MGRTKGNGAAASEAVQKTPGSQEVSQTTQGAECDSGAVVTREIIGPEDEAELMGCQDAEEGFQPDAPLEYAVTGCALLNLREAPSLDAPIIVALPRGVGVSNTGQVQGPWWEVATGKLRGWVLDQYLEPVWS